MSKKKSAQKNTRPAQPAQKKAVQPAHKKAAPPKVQPWMLVTIVMVALAALGAVAMVLMNQEAPEADTLPAFVTVQEAYELYQQGAFVLDVRTQEEWDDYHAPDTTLIPLDELAARLSELPQDQQIVVVCRSGNRSQEGRDILLQAGFDATSMNGGLNNWRDAGYPIE